MDATEFKIRLKRCNLTRAEAAERLGVKLDTINAYCKGARAIPHDLTVQIDQWVQHTTEKWVQDGKLVQTDVPIEKPVPILAKDDDFETGYIPITEEYARSLGYGTVYREKDWFDRAREAILNSRRLGESRGKIDHPRWQK